MEGIRSPVRVRKGALFYLSARPLSPLTQGGSIWVTSVDNPMLAVQATVEEFGFKHEVSDPTLEVVQLKVRDLIERGAVLVQRCSQIR